MNIEDFIAHIEIINSKTMEQIPKIVLDEAKKQGLGEMEYRGKYNNAEVYGEVGEVDKDGFPVPTGLPCYILLKDGKTECIDGLEALRIDITD